MCEDGINHVSVMSLSLMLLFKTKSFFKANLCTKLLPGNFDFLKCTEVIWKTGCSVWTAALDSHEHLALQSHRLRVGVGAGAMPLPPPPEQKGPMFVTGVTLVCSRGTSIFGLGSEA